MQSLLKAARLARANKITGPFIPYTQISSIYNKRPESDTPSNLKSSKLGNPMQYIKSHPYKITLVTACFITSLVPSLASGPILTLLGLGDHGPVAGGLAAWFQSHNGETNSNGVFATLQSAAMGGKSADIMDWVVSGTFAAFGLITAQWKRIRNFRWRGR